MLFSKKTKITITTFLALVLTAGVVWAVNISSTDKYSWGENIGWLNWNSSHSGVTVYDDRLEGYIWSENTGWISLACENTSFCSTTDYGIDNDGDGNLSGYAYSENAGWINFNPSHSQVTIDASSSFQGYAWSENLGWLNLNCANLSTCSAVDYGPQTTWTANTAPSSPTSPSPSDGATNISTSPTLSLTVTDPDADAMDVSFYNAANNNLIDTNSSVSSGNSASVTWSGLSEGTSYSWYAVASDGEYSATSSSYSFTTETTGGAVPVSFLQGSSQDNAQNTTEDRKEEKEPEITLRNGDLISTPNSFDVWIIKKVGNESYRRLILNPDIFNSYGHLKWDEIKEVSQVTLDNYTISNLVQEVNPDGTVADPKVYAVVSSRDADTGTKHHLNITAGEFEAAGLDWKAIYHINATEASDNFYPEDDPLTSEDDVKGWAHKRPE